MWNQRIIKARFEVCKSGARVRLRCWHGNDRVLAVACGKVSECELCLNAWRAKVRRRIMAGCEGAVNLWFFTATFSEDISLDEGMRRWKVLWKEMARRMPGARMFRVVELTKRGRPHFHAVVDGPMPVLLKPNKGGEYAAEYLARQSVAGREFIQRVLVPSGFGYIAHCERVRLGGKGAASYLSKYLTKAQAKSLVREDGRRVRVAEGSRDWLVNPPVPTYRYGTVVVTSAKESEPDCRCQVPRRKMLTPEGQRYDGEARAFWRGQTVQIEQEAGIYRDCVMATQRAYHKGGDTLVQCRTRQNFYKRELRKVGYSGPLSLIVADRRGTERTYNAVPMYYLLRSMVGAYNWSAFGKWLTEQRKEWRQARWQFVSLGISEQGRLTTTRLNRWLSSPMAQVSGSDTYGSTLTSQRARRRSPTNRRNVTGLPSMSRGQSFLRTRLLAVPGAQRPLIRRRNGTRYIET